MKKKIILVGPKATAEVFAGVKYAANIVAKTLGPFGRNFASGVRGGPVAISNDGVSLLKEIEGPTEIQDLGVRAVREAATKTNDAAGDGTSTAAVLTNAVLEILPAPDPEIVGYKAPVELIEQIKKEKDIVVAKLKEMATPVETEQQLVEVARVSGEYKDLAEIIGKAQFTVGKYGTVLCEEDNAATDSVEYIHGVRIDNGYSSSRIITNQERQSLEVEDVYVILTNKVFHGASFGNELKNVWEFLAKKAVTNVVIMARAFDDAAIGYCVKNITTQGAMNIFPINAPYVDQNEIMEDLAAVLGAKYINVEERNIESMTGSDVGHASKIVAKRFEGIVTGYPTGTDEMVDNRVAARIEHIEKKLTGKVSEFEKRNLEQRLSQLKAGTAIIKVGADTEQERRHKKDKVEDAVNAVKWAHREGTVPGGGKALALIAHGLPDDFLLKKALTVPHEQIMSMAPKHFVIHDWVRDPVKVVYTALTNACDIAASLATTEVAINFEREKPQYVTKVDTQIAEHPEE